MRVLLIDSVRMHTQNVAAILASGGATADDVDDIKEAQSVLRHDDFDLILLIAPTNSMDVSNSVRSIRMTKTALPLLVIATSSAFATAAALGAGADDVVQEAVIRTELLARCQALVRRSRGLAIQAVTVGPLTLDLDSREVTVDGRRVNLTGREFAVLEILATRRNRAVRKESIVAGLYALDGDEPDSKIIDVFVCKVRRKLAQAGAPNLIATIWGVGYRLQDANVVEEPLRSTAMNKCSPAVGATA